MRTYRRAPPSARDIDVTCFPINANSADTRFTYASRSRSATRIPPSVLRSSVSRIVDRAPPR